MRKSLHIMLTRWPAKDLRKSTTAAFQGSSAWRLRRAQKRDSEAALRDLLDGAWN